MKLLDKDGLEEKGMPHSSVQLWRLMQQGKFPRQIKIGSKNAWLESENHLVQIAFEGRLNRHPYTALLLGFRPDKFWDYVRHAKRAGATRPNCSVDGALLNTANSQYKLLQPRQDRRSKDEICIGRERC